VVTIRFVRLTEDEAGRPKAEQAGTVTADGTRLTASEDRLLAQVRQTLMVGVDLTDPAAVEAALRSAPQRFRGSYFWAEEQRSAPLRAAG
jgi:hypothetical protein